MAGGSEDLEEINLEFTPTWVVALVCSAIVLISLCVERFLHFLGKFLKSKGQKPLYEALLKIKEELMLLGFISLLLTVSQGSLQNICVPKELYDHMLPCKKEGEGEHGNAATSHYQVSLIHHGTRRILAGGGSPSSCIKEGKVPLLSIEALHQLHIFIFVLAISHVTFCLITMLLGSLKISQWQHWENSIQEELKQKKPDSPINQVTHVHQLEFIKKRFKGYGANSVIVRWLHSFGKQFYGSVRKSDYKTMRWGFIMTHSPGNPAFNFHKYMIRTLEADFKKVVGISWYLWVFVVVFLLLNVNGWHTYFWIAFIPLILLLTIGTKLEHIFSQLAHEVAEKHTAIAGELVVTPSDDHFWFRRPKIILYLIHFILFQNAFEIAFFFWILVTYGFDSCLMGQAPFIFSRLAIGVVIQVLCGYSTLPLYTIVTQMGTLYKKAIFDEQVYVNIAGWAKKAKMNRGIKTVNGEKKAGMREDISRSPNCIRMQDMSQQRTAQLEEGIIEDKPDRSDAISHQIG